MILRVMSAALALSLVSGCMQESPELTRPAPNAGALAKTVDAGGDSPPATRGGYKMPAAASQQAGPWEVFVIPTPGHIVLVSETVACRVTSTVAEARSRAEAMIAYNDARDDRLGIQGMRKIGNQGLADDSYAKSQCYTVTVRYKEKVEEMSFSGPEVRSGEGPVKVICKRDPNIKDTEQSTAARASKALAIVSRSQREFADYLDRKRSDYLSVGAVYDQLKPLRCRPGRV